MSFVYNSAASWEKYSSPLCLPALPYDDVKCFFLGVGGTQEDLKNNFTNLYAFQLGLHPNAFHATQHEHEGTRPLIKFNALIR